MFRNYIKVSFRNLLRNKSFTLINVLGLATGLATCIMIMLFVKNELSYDKHHTKADRIVRLVFRGKVKGEEMREASVFPPVAKTMVKDYPEVETAARLSYGRAPIVSLEGKLFHERNIAYVDQSFFDVFTIPFVKGDALTALSAPNTVVITEQLATKYFGSENALGKILNFKNFGQDLKVTGVIREMPQASHFQFDMFASMLDVPDALSNSWMTSNYYTYLVLKPGYDPKQLEAKLPAAVEKYMGPQLKQAMGITLKEFQAAGDNVGLFVQPLTDIHLHSDLTNDLQPPGSIDYVYIFSAIAAFMLVIACINFMNLSTASADKRAREVGIRKVLGSLKKQLVTQFMIESFLVTGAALLLSLVLVQMALPVFNKLSGKELALPLSLNSWFIPALLVTGAVTAIISGTYPAFFLSSFNPVKVLKGQPGVGRGRLTLRSGLVVFQFAISIILMVSTAVVFNQLSFIQSKNLGYNKDQVLLFPGAAALGNQQLKLQDMLQRDARVASFTSSNYLPAGPSYGNNFFIYEHTSANQIKSLRYEVDEDYIATLGMKIKSGRNFAGDYGTDSSAIVVNEAAVLALGWKDSPLGKSLLHADNHGKIQKYHVIGVVNDFHFKSLHEKISPLVMTYNPHPGQLIVRVNTGDIAGVINKMEAAWKALKTDQLFTYSFLDEQFFDTYKAEQTTGKILGIFSGLTIAVACLGLFGLATFTVRQRSREVGIRKVLGASVAGILILLSKDFLRLVIVAFCIAAPIAWMLMNKWLQNFEYRINVAWWIFAVAAFVAVVITLFTVGFRGLKAALTSPAAILKNE